MEKQEKKQDLRVTRTKTLLKDTLLFLLNEKKFEDISVSELTKLAGINRKTFYLHYSSTRDLLNEIQDELLTQIVNISNDYNVLSPDFSPYPFFLELTQFLNSAYNKHRAILFFSSDGVSAAKIKRVILNNTVPNVTQLYKINKIQLDFYFDYILGGLLSLYLSWFSHNPPLVSVEELAQIASEICYTGIDDIVKNLKEPPSV